jgi:hypothetical protein
MLRLIKIGNIIKKINNNFFQLSLKNIKLMEEQKCLVTLQF